MKKRVVLKCLDVVGPKMAGPAIRYVEIAKALSPFFEVVLLVPFKTDFQIPSVKILPHKEGRKEIQGAYALITQHLGYFNALQILFSKTLLVIDGYDPEPLEYLELFKERPRRERNRRLSRGLARLDFDFSFADLVLAASSRQSDLWLGYLMAESRLSFEGSLEVIELPFGCPEFYAPPAINPLIERFKIESRDFVLLWGGGIWNWFDPLTLLKAVKQCVDRGISIKLLFMGVKHPNESISEMEMSKRALALSKELDLFEKQVFFHFGWTPYEERIQFLAVASAGISTHFEHLETRFSFRTRILDYFWAALPVIATEGDSLSEKIEEKGAGIVVPAENIEALALAIETLATNLTKRSEMSQASKSLGDSFQWKKTTSTLVKWLENRRMHRSCRKRFSLLLTWGMAFFRLNIPGQIAKVLLSKLGRWR